MDLFLVLPLILIAAVALWALVVKMVNDKDRRDDDEGDGPSASAPVTSCCCMNCYECLAVTRLGAAT